MKLQTVSVVTLLLLSACGSDGAAGANGQNGTPGENGKVDPTPSLVSPSQGILDREVEVEIGGSGTKFTDNDKPDFGAGITVTESHAASATLLVAKIKIAKDAALGKHDVKIGSITATGAFSVIPAIDVKVEGGAVAVDQGGILQFDIVNNDTKAFDPNAFKLEAAGVIDVGSSASSPQAATGFVLAAPLATPAKSQVVVSNVDAKGNPRLSFASDPQALTVNARAPQALTMGTSKTETFSGDLKTNLYKITPAAGASILDFRMEVTDDKSATQPYIFLFGGAAKADTDQLLIAGPPSSLFGPEPPPYDIHAVLPVAAGGTDVYAIFVDLGKKAGNTMKLTPTSTPATKTAEAATAHAADAPQAITPALPASDGQIVDAELKAAAEVDAYKFTAVAGDKIQLSASASADLEIILTKDATVLSDPQGTPAANKKVLGAFYPGVKAAANTTITLTGTTDLFVVVRSDSQGKVATGKYALAARKVQ